MAPVWKYEFMAQFKEAIKTTRNPGELIKLFMQTELKKYGQDITKLIPKLIKDTSKVPLVLIGQDKELESIKSSKSMLESEFNTVVEIVKTEDSNHPKAKNASPGKLAILIE